MNREQRKAIKTLVRREVRMQCADCGAQVIPQQVDVIREAAVYSAQCTCGALLQGVIGPAPIVADFRAFITGYAVAKGAGMPRAREQPAPPGWPVGGGLRGDKNGQDYRPTGKGVRP